MADGLSAGDRVRVWTAPACRAIRRERHIQVIAPDPIGSGIRADPSRPGGGTLGSDAAALRSTEQFVELFSNAATPSASSTRA